MKYKITIETDVEHKPGNANHWEALLANPSNKFKVVDAEMVE